MKKIMILAVIAAISVLLVLGGCGKTTATKTSATSSKTSSGTSAKPSGITYFCEHKAPFKINVKYLTKGEIRGIKMDTYQEIWIKKDSSGKMMFTKKGIGSTNGVIDKSIGYHFFTADPKSFLAFTQPIDQETGLCIDSAAMAPYYSDYSMNAGTWLEFKSLGTAPAYGKDQPVKYDSLPTTTINGFNCYVIQRDEKIQGCFSKEHCMDVYQGGDAFGATVGIKVLEVSYADFSDNIFNHPDKSVCTGQQVDASSWNLDNDGFLANAEKYLK
jgi:hypothetical protein